MVCDKAVCERWRVKDSVSESGVWKMVCHKVVCERWCVTKLCVKDGGWKIVCDKVVCERWCVTKWSERWSVKHGERWCVCVCGGNPCSEGLSSHVQFLVSVPNLQAGVTPTQNEWIEKPGSFNSKIHVSTSLISSSLTQLGALYVQKGFFPTWRRSSTQPAQVSIVAVRFLHGRAFLSLHFSHYISCLYVGSFL